MTRRLRSGISSASSGRWANKQAAPVGMLFCAAGVSAMFHTYILPEVYELFVEGEHDMTHFVNEDAFFAWYDGAAKEPRLTHGALLDDLTRRHRETRREEYVLPPEKTVSGREERYPFHYENVGCCGASTVFYHF